MLAGISPIHQNLSVEILNFYQEIVNADSFFHIGNISGPTHLPSIGKMLQRKGLHHVENHGAFRHTQ